MDWMKNVKSASNPLSYDWAIETLGMAQRSAPVPIAEQISKELLALMERENQAKREVSNARIDSITSCKMFDIKAKADDSYTNNCLTIQ